jgi:hypothetical protein
VIPLSRHWGLVIVQHKTPEEWKQIDRERETREREER